MTPDFVVSAEYFYALGANLSPEVTAEERYRLATSQDERQIRDELRRAIAAGFISGTLPITPEQAARRLRALGAIADAGSPECRIGADTPLHDLIQGWLDYRNPSPEDDPARDITPFWNSVPGVPRLANGHLDLVLRAITGDHRPLIDAIKAIPVQTVGELAQRTRAQWEALFRDAAGLPRVALLPPFTFPGTPEERIAAFIRHVRKFFDVTSEDTILPPVELNPPPVLGVPSSAPFQRFVERFRARTGVDFAFGQGWNEAAFAGAIADVFPDDADARAWLDAALRTIDDLYRITDVGIPELRFSLMEALYARGFAGRQAVQALSGQDFQEVLTGTVAHAHAGTIYINAGGNRPPDEPRVPGFRAINADGSLVSCVPPPHLSPLGPVSYLHEMLRVSEDSTCREPLPGSGTQTLRAMLADRRGPLGELDLTRANLETPVPVIDLVSECLEAMVAGASGGGGAVYSTASDELGGHRLHSGDAHESDSETGTEAGETAFRHNAATLFATLPEHSSPATPVQMPVAYDRLRNDLSAPELPYSQPLDVARSYLDHLHTSRYAVMRRFRTDITELALDPAREPAGFQRHLWRYPVRIEIAREYLGITPEEHALLFTTDIDEARLRELYGVSPAEGATWPDVVVQVPEFIERTGIDFCQFIKIWESGFVGFRVEGIGSEPDGCEPCDLATKRIVFEAPSDVRQGLKRLAVFIRLWRKLQAVAGARYSFTELRDICQVLGLFGADGVVNADFLRQLAAFQILRDHFALVLRDSADETPGTGADRTHLLALWAGVSARKWSWAVDHLLDQIRHYAQARYACGTRPPELIKLLAANLTPLSRVAGFDPGGADATWHVRPTHTLRFAEVLAKIYASDFGVGEVLFLCTADAHVNGDDPFALQTDNEALDEPLELPDDEDQDAGAYSLWSLRHKLLAVEVSDEEAASWTWTRIETSLREDFGFVPQDPEADPLLSLGAHFFPGVLASCGCTVDVRGQQYRVPLASTSPAMWNTAPDGPFRYDAGARELWTQLPLMDEVVLAKLARVKPLSADEQRAVRDLYFSPRVDLAHFAFVFPSFAEAAQHLIQEADEGKRWAYFQRAFARCHARARLIAEHLTGHVAEATGRTGEEGIGLAWKLLVHLLADENRATASWESDTGEQPEVTWTPQPNGGAFAALLGLTGTGLLGEIESMPASGEDGELVWREFRGPMNGFGDVRNAWCAPVPTILPAIDLGLTPAQERFLGVRNGFAFSSSDSAPLGGAQGFRVRWRGALLVENAGLHAFWAGAPTPDGEAPSLDAARDRRWRVTLTRGQKTWVLLSHQWPGENAPAACSTPLSLKRGAYELTIELEQPAPILDGPEDVCARTAGFQLKYSGPDTGDQIRAVPFDRLFLDRKDATLADGISDAIDGQARQLLEILYPSTLRDMRRTYQRAFKALLFAHRFGLSARPVADSGQSELGYLLDHADDFAGRAYYLVGPGYAVHRAFLDFNLLPLRDNYHAPAAAQDQRAAPSQQRQQAIFDWWERTFDYTVMRQEARTAPEHPVWLLFHEAAESHSDNPMHLLRHLGVDLRHAALVLRYYRQQDQDPYQVTSADLEDERWAIRAWRVETWLRNLEASFLSTDIRAARPELWASDDPSRPVNGPPPTGNENLTRFVRDGVLENRAPRRYEGIQRLNDGLRVRARQALLAYLCAMDRVALPLGGFARTPKDVSELLLLDAEAGLEQRVSRIEEAVSATQMFVQRYRLGLEPGWNAGAELPQLWDRRFATFRTWEACKRRELYRENWIDWGELEQARRTEAFRALESELRRGTLTMPVPAGAVHWNEPRPAAHPSLTPLQAREPARMHALVPARQGLALQGMPERHARSSWLASLPVGTSPSTKLPVWFEAAVRLGTRFVRVAAAGLAPASARLAPHDVGPAGCCVECGREHEPMVDEYYFWITDSRHYTKVFQDADVVVSPIDRRPAWHQDETIPTLLHWPSEPMVHLMWCRVHDGELQPPRRSHQGMRTNPTQTPQLRFMGRVDDSLRFEIDGGEAPPGYDPPPPPGFRYDLATDSAVVLPLVVAPPAVGIAYPGGLPVYPHFAYALPGAPLVPSRFSTAMAVAGALRTHCRFEAALKWYEQVFNPLQEDATWCAGDADGLCDSIVSDEVARHRAVTLGHLETLLAWGDAVMHAGSPEAMQQARLIFDTATRILGERPRSVQAEDADETPQKLATFIPRLAPLNPRLLTIYERVEDRLALIHARSSLRRLQSRQQEGRTPGMAFWSESALRDGWRRADDACLDEGDWCQPPCPYRFMFLLQKAQELTGEVRGLGGALLAAYEKGDGEYLSALRTSHERQLLELTLAIRQDQWRESDWQVQALQKTKEIAQTRRRYTQFLLDRGLIVGEIAYVALTTSSLGMRIASQYPEGIARVLALVPDLYVGVATTERLPVGSKQAETFQTISRIMNILADAFNTMASLSLTQAGWQRREEEWRHQVEVLDIEIEQIERQILAAERRRDIALRELNNHQRQIENVIEVQDFLRDKFTNHQLYLWLQKETAALHYQMYELALHAARQAQRAFNYERGHTGRRFLPAEIWDDLHEGLQAGERLQLALRQMEKAYLDENVREYELTKHISLRMCFPAAFLQLKTTGVCELEIPEWMFDLDYPGHYMRRIKNVTLTIPCVVGPYTGVHCRLTLLGSAARVDPRLTPAPAECCDTTGALHNGYAATPDDSRIVKQYAATEGIATSTGQNDSGMFELNFRDERYLPFELAGAVSRWRIELPPENNYFDVDTLSDVVMHLSYMAREGGEALRHAANEVAQKYLPDAGWRLFDVRHELPNAWQRFHASATSTDAAARTLELRLGRNMFAFLPGHRHVTIMRLAVLFEAPGAEPSAHHIVEFQAGGRPTMKTGERCDVHSIHCVASAEWPGFYHGVLELPLGPLGQNGDQPLGTLRFPVDTGPVSRMFLLCGYEVG